MSKLLDGLETATGSWWMKLIPYAVVVVLVLMAGGAAYHMGVSTEHQARVAEVASLRKQHSDELWAIDKAHRDALEKAEAERDAQAQKAAADMAALDAKHFQELKDEHEKGEAAVAAVRAGTLRVRQRFTCPAAVRDTGARGGAAQAASAAGMGDAAGERGLSADDAGVLLRAGQRANSVSEKLKALQDIVRGWVGQ